MGITVLQDTLEIVEQLRVLQMGATAKVRQASLTEWRWQDEQAHC